MDLTVLNQKHLNPKLKLLQCTPKQCYTHLSALKSVGSEGSDLFQIALSVTLLYQLYLHIYTAYSEAKVAI